jgi:hypothetical protein
MPVPYVGVKYSRTSNLDWSEQVTCPHCGLRSKASVRVVSTGTATAHYGVFRESAKERAGMNAFTGGVELARELLEHARCPTCAKRRGGATWLWARGLFLWSFPAAAVFLFVRATTPDAESVQLPFLVLLGGGVIAVTAFRVWRRLALSDRAVYFESAIEVADHLAQPTARREAPPPTAAPELPEWVKARDEAARAERPADDSGLELDLDRNWKGNKKD